ncbi:divalent cation tolerance protein [Amycolatopsis xylanica]|uniref:Divalent cation tolerance protein n=1 Tax=Amycolatopsis xylanica TaxID=589385 RepID=A0A1H3GPA2_9PSEU|nr:divalent-cation tolerance protein CutA [Amycolatopsis xylanica]SDY04815.1 divalent cation tolerance protein [Amycolatopsis xylanica]
MVVHLLVTTTTPNRESGANLATSALSAHLAATSQLIGPLDSFFWHLGENGTGEEWNVTFKTTDARYAELEAHIVENHPWKKPEVTAVEIVRGTDAYLRWVEEATTDRSSSG